MEVSEELGITKSIISKLWPRFQNDGNVSRRYNTDRPRVTTPNEDQCLAVIPKRSRQRRASDLSRQLSATAGTTVSKQNHEQTFETYWFISEVPKLFCLIEPLPWFSGLG
ncbi:uncharacterized protein TNCV_1524641 [Trichonephila clavipes]|nr:uncharacterized protein TNCV_1524641 [Trichonephila clavipes]